MLPALVALTALSNVYECDTLSTQVDCEASVYCYWVDGDVKPCKTKIDCKETLKTEAECKTLPGFCWYSRWWGCSGCSTFLIKDQCKGNDLTNGCTWQNGECITITRHECTDEGYCLGRGTATKSGDDCSCTCNGAYEARLQCGYCPSQFHNDCSECVRPGVSLALCQPCSSAADCNGRAAAVSPDVTSASGCVCTCRNRWFGDACEYCPTGFINDCTVCGPGHIPVGDACEVCTSGQHCSGRGLPSVSASGLECDCSCSDQWRGTQCEQCDVIYDQLTCASCADDHVGYPSCRRCDVAADCSNHALNTHSTDSVTCNCDCSDFWGGHDCSLCPSQYSNCDTGECSMDFFGPLCTRCTVDDDCSGNAVTVVGSVTANAYGGFCTCTCAGKWGDVDCSFCPARYNNATCRTCLGGVDGYVNYPTCEQCTLAAHCNGKGTEVSAVGDVCVCTCRNKWDGNQCDVCDAKYDATKDCNACGTGRINFPTCEACDMAVHCSGNADAVVAGNNRDMCLCQCSNGWTGATCDSCPAGIFAGPQCEVCDDIAQAWPVCGSCDVDAHCNGRATSVMEVTSPMGGACQCACNNHWSGDRCDVCDTPFAGADCDECMMGFVPTPGGCSECTMAYCNNRAVAVTSTATSCSCQCTDKWESVDCSTCPARYNQATCSECADNHILFPTCTPCSAVCGPGAAHAESDATKTGCVCTCVDQWYGATCEMCSESYNQMTCNACARGRVNYPQCTICSVHDHCSGHAVNVAAESSECVCECRDMWNGSVCDVCPEIYGAAQDCSECAAGRAEYPECWVCDRSYCNGRSEASVVNGGCRCGTCDGAWTGGVCSVCPEGFTGANCDECVGGVGTPPDCSVCVCAGGVASIEGNECRCTCPVQYELIDDITCRACQFTDGCLSESTACECLCTSNWTSPVCDLAPQAPVSLEGATPTVPLSDISYTSDAVKSITSAASFTFSTSGALGAQRLSSLLTLCGSADDVLDPEIAPLGLKIGDGENAMYIGGIVGDLVVMLTPIVVQFLAVAGRAWVVRDGKGGVFQRDAVFDKTSADLRFPYLSLFAVIFMYHGMATCALKLIIFGASPWERVLGTATINLFNLGFLAVVLRKVSSLVKEVEYYERQTTFFSRYLLGPGEWVSASDSRGVSRWGILFEMYRKGWTWFLIAECGVLLCITGVQVVEATDFLHCRNLAAALATLFGVFATVIIFGAPWASPFDNHANLLIVGLEAVAMASLAVGFGSEDRSNASFTVAENILLAVSYITLVKGMIDPLLLFYVEWKRRREIQSKYDADKVMEKSVQLLGEPTDNIEDWDPEEEPKVGGTTLSSPTNPLCSGTSTLIATSISSPFVVNPTLRTSESYARLSAPSFPKFIEHRANSTPNIQL